MSFNQPRRTGRVRPAAGIKEGMRAKSRGRRDCNRTLLEIAEASPAIRNDLLPKLSSSSVEIAKLIPASRRARRTGKEQIERIKASICKFGVCQPVLVDGAYRIVHGHGIVDAARALGLSELPVIIVDHLTPAELRLLSIALNRIGETGAWDETALKLEIEELIDLGEDVVLTGFDEAEVDILLLDDESVDRDENDLSSFNGSAISIDGDLWQLGRHRLIVGDARASLSYERLFGQDELARVALTDEPYNVPNVGHVTSQGHPSRVCDGERRDVT
jgi:hypothetical protein